MKINKLIYCCIALATGIFSACSELDGKDHYSLWDSIINTNDVVVVNQTSEDYLASTPEFSQMNALFQEYGIYDELKAKGQLSTILVVNDDNFNLSRAADEKMVQKVRSHISDVALSPANLKTEKNDMRVMMWHGKYVNVNLDDEAYYNGKIVDHIFFNTSVVQKVIKTNNGFIYVISDLIETPESLNDYINNLGDDYSIIRESVKASGGKEFDRKNSKPIGVNSEGNTVYDSVFIYKNTHFEEKGIDLSSESLTATMFLCSNDVIEEAIADAARRLNMWDLARDWNMDREFDFKTTMLNWIMDASFYNQRFTAQDITNKDPENMLTSVFGKMWKTAAQDVEVEPVELSNAVVYKVKKLHIPNNLIIYRLKEEFFIYEYCTAEQKESWFQMTNMAYNNCSTEVEAWTPLSGIWPLHENRVLILKAGEEPQGFWQFDYTPCKRVFTETYTRKELVKNGKLKTQMDREEIRPFLVPPGKYRLAFGSKQGAGLDIKASVFVKGNTEPLSTSSLIQLGSSTTYHYDRGATLSDAYPEGYNKSAEGMSSKASNYDTDGGLLIEEVVVPDVKGDGSPVELMIRFSCDSWGTQTKITLNHWCLRPTADNY